MPLDEVISLGEARERGSKRYFTGIPCRTGHTSDRMVSNRRCVRCLRLLKAAWNGENAGRRQVSKRAWDEANRERLIAKRAADYAADPAGTLEKGRAWRAANADLYRQIQAAWRAAHPGETARRAAEWREANPEAVRVHRRRRRARLKGGGGSHTADEIATLYDEQDGRCANPRCRASLAAERQADHIIPLAGGGSDAIGNIQLLCPPCNQSKGALDPFEWARRLGIAPWWRDRLVCDAAD